MHVHPNLASARYPGHDDARAAAQLGAGERGERDGKDAVTLPDPGEKQELPSAGYAHRELHMKLQLTAAKVPAAEVAISYVRDLRWAVVPGCDQGRHGRRCGRSHCLTMAPHPASQHGDLMPTQDEETVLRWWRRGPEAQILLPTGRSFDVLDVPTYAAEEVLRRLEATGYKLRPIASTGEGRLLIWVIPGALVLDEITTRRRWSYGDLDLHCHGVGEYVPAPPSFGTTWLEPPTLHGHQRLLHCHDILGTVVYACERLAGARPAAAVMHGGVRGPRARR
jgi:hypothetical protein